MNYTYEYTTTVGNEEALAVLAGMGAVVWIISIIIGILTIVSMWKIFKKAGKNGWEAIIPIYNIIVLLEISKIPVWQIIFYFIPFANIYIMFKQYIELAKKFGKSTGFGVLTVFFPIICLPILAFGSAKYEENQVTSNEHTSSILDVNESGVPNNSEAKDFSYGYEKEETVIIPEVNSTEESTASDSSNNAESSLEAKNPNSESSNEMKSE